MNLLIFGLIFGDVAIGTVLGAPLNPPTTKVHHETTTPVPARHDDHAGGSDSHGTPHSSPRAEHESRGHDSFSGGAKLASHDTSDTTSNSNSLHTEGGQSGHHGDIHSGLRGHHDEHSSGAIGPHDGSQEEHRQRDNAVHHDGGVGKGSHLNVQHGAQTSHHNNAQGVNRHEPVHAGARTGAGAGAGSRSVGAFNGIPGLGLLQGFGNSIPALAAAGVNSFNGLMPDFNALTGNRGISNNPVLGFLKTSAGTIPIVGSLLGASNAGTAQHHETEHNRAPNRPGYGAANYYGTDGNGDNRHGYGGGNHYDNHYANHHGNGDTNYGNGANHNGNDATHVGDNKASHHGTSPTHDDGGYITPHDGNGGDVDNQDGTDKSAETVTHDHGATPKHDGDPNLPDDGGDQEYMHEHDIGHNGYGINGDNNGGGLGGGFNLFSGIPLIRGLINGVAGQIPIIGPAISTLTGGGGGGGGGGNTGPNLNPIAFLTQLFSSAMNFFPLLGGRG